MLVQVERHFMNTCGLFGSPGGVKKTVTMSKVNLPISERHFCTPCDHWTGRTGSKRERPEVVHDGCDGFNLVTKSGPVVVYAKDLGFILGSGHSRFPPSRSSGDQGISRIDQVRAPENLQQPVGARSEDDSTDSIARGSTLRRCFKVKTFQPMWSSVVVHGGGFRSADGW